MKITRYHREDFQMVVTDTQRRMDEMRGSKDLVVKYVSTRQTDDKRDKRTFR